MSRIQANELFIQSSKLSLLEVILLQLAKDLPEHIEPHELLSIIQELLNTKSEDEIYQKLNLSTLKNKFENDMDWEVFKKLLGFTVLKNIVMNQ
ncbi:hypothetical protein E2K73_13965 [Acinetobacter sp. RF15A]|uniref:hypothetical protein n=1 Tax=unclassified Acinetobacter TaxID=196816 RepID=UPI0011973F67|nr:MULTISPECIES: hypothetical protein [unclassified Acinetobacter]TSH68270.1 hypothetical protein E2K73_13965 [Acinetobacter sp. RF15A]TSI14040.1 hypothetical protein E2K74_13925 [Acinetobacter sp. RF15B]